MILSCSLSEGHSFRLVCEKEVRSVLGHHCSAVSGSEVVYGRELQARPIRKLQMLLRLIRIGMGLEEIAEHGTMAGVTPGVRTPGPQFGIHGAEAVTPVLPPRVLEPMENPVNEAVSIVSDQEEMRSTKDELEDCVAVANSAGELSLFPETVVQNGLIEIESSSK